MPTQICIQPLKTQRLILDELQLNDSKAIFEMFSDPDVVEYYDFEVFKCEEEAVELIKKGSAYVCDLSAEEIRQHRGTLTEAG